MLADDGRVVFLDSVRVDGARRDHGRVRTRHPERAQGDACARARVFLFSRNTRFPDEIMDAFALRASVLKRDWDALTSAFIRTGFVQTPISGGPPTARRSSRGSPADGVPLSAAAGSRPSSPSACRRIAAGSRRSARSRPCSSRWASAGRCARRRTSSCSSARSSRSRASSRPSTARSTCTPPRCRGRSAARSARRPTSRPRAARRAPHARQRAALGELLELAASAEPRRRAAAAAARRPGGDRRADLPRRWPRGRRARRRPRPAITPLDSACAVLSSVEGSTLRRIVHDIDSTKLLLSLASPSARKVRRLAVDALASALAESPGARARAAAAAAAPSWPEPPDEAVARPAARRALPIRQGLAPARHARRQVAARVARRGGDCALACLVVRIRSPPSPRGLAQQRQRHIRLAHRTRHTPTSS